MQFNATQRNAMQCNAMPRETLMTAVRICREEELAAREHELRLLTAAVTRRSSSSRGGNGDGTGKAGAAADARGCPSPIGFPLRLAPAMQPAAAPDVLLPSSSAAAAAGPDNGGGRRSNLGAMPGFGSAEAATPGFGSGFHGYSTGGGFGGASFADVRSGANDAAPPPAAAPRPARWSDLPAEQASRSRQAGGKPISAPGSGAAARHSEPVQSVASNSRLEARSRDLDAAPASWRPLGHERRFSAGSELSGHERQASARSAFSGAAADDRRDASTAAALVQQPEQRHDLLGGAVRNGPSPTRRHSEPAEDSGADSAPAAGRVVGAGDLLSLQEAISIGETRCAAAEHQVTQKRCTPCVPGRPHVCGNLQRPPPANHARICCLISCRLWNPAFSLLVPFVEAP